MAGSSDEIPAAKGAESAVIARARGLSVSYESARGRAEVVRDVHLEIHSGEVVAIVGESGSGKTTLGLAMAGLLPEHRSPLVEGEVEVGGVDLRAARAADLRRLRLEDLGVIYQEPTRALDPTMRIGRQLTERGAEPEVAAERLSECEVDRPNARLRQYAFELSGGIAQRVAISMALTSAPRSGVGEGIAAQAKVKDSAPRLLVADEPTTALDASTALEILRLFDRVREQHGCGMILITHDLNAAARLADRIAVMYGGRICELGSTAAVFQDPRHRYTEALLGAQLTAGRKGIVTDIPGHPPSVFDHSPGCSFAPRCAAATTDCLEAPPTLAKQGDGRLAACLHPATQGSPALGAPRPPAVAGRIEVKGTASTPRSATKRRGEILLSATSVHKRFSAEDQGTERIAVCDVSLELRSGQSLAVVGESGSGKTTLLRMAAGLEVPSEGEITWPSNSGRPQLIHQDFGAALTSWLTVRSQIAERLQVRGVPRKQREQVMQELLAEVGLEDPAILDARPGQLSGGQRQRVVIARALASDPSALLCDEPTSALDASFAVRVVRLLEDLRERLGIGLLIVTHDMGVARHLAEQTIVMQAGEVVEEGPTATVLDNPRENYTKTLINAVTAPLINDAAPAVAALE